MTPFAQGVSIITGFICMAGVCLILSGIQGLFAHCATKETPEKPFEGSGIGRGLNAGNGRAGYREAWDPINLIFTPTKLDSKYRVLGVSTQSSDHIYF